MPRMACNPVSHSSMDTPPDPALLPTLVLAESIGASQVIADSIDPDVVEFGIQQRLIHLTDDGYVELTAAGRKKAAHLRTLGQPLLSASHVEATVHGLRIIQDLTAEEWLLQIRRLQMVKSAYLQYLADLVSYGRARFTPEWVDAQLEQMQFPFEDVEHANAIACTSLTLRETHALTAEHYYILGLKFPDSPADQQTWADNARAHDLSPIALRRSIEAGEIITDATLAAKTGRDSGILTIQDINLRLTRWANQTGGLTKIKTWPTEKRRALLEELSTAHDLYTQIAATLP